MLNKSHKNVSCINCQARSESIFYTFCSNEVATLDGQKTCSYYKKNQPLFVEGSFSRGVYCIQEGKVKVYNIGEGGKEQIISILNDGDVFGYNSLLSGDAFQSSATTLEESNICFIPKENFLDKMEESPSFRKEMFKILTKEISKRSLSLLIMSQKQVRERLALALLELDEIYGDQMINLSREDLANIVGTATETIIRLLKEMKEDGMIEVFTRKILLTDRQGLNKLAGN